MSKVLEIEDKLKKLESFILKLNSYGMEGRAGTCWPVIIKRYTYEKVEYVCEYPESYFFNLQFEYELYIFSEKKSDRLAVVKFLLDKLMGNEIDIHLYHFGTYLLYSDYYSSQRSDDYNAASIGKKRATYAATLPKSRFLNNDDYITASYSNLMRKKYTDISEYRSNPVLSNVRMLFTPDQIGAYGWPTYSNADWVEPISGKLDLECNRWVGEKDPMAPQTKKEGIIEGLILIGTDGNGNRHFVDGEALNAGSYIEVKFGDGWIAGRYEWNFDKNSLIQIHSRNEVLYIKEGHEVRIRR